jgi:hypothetical protein
VTPLGSKWYVNKYVYTSMVIYKVIYLSICICLIICVTKTRNICLEYIYFEKGNYLIGKICIYVSLSKWYKR